MAKPNLKILISIALLIIGGIMHLYLTTELGLSGPGFFMALFGIVSLALTYTAWKLKPEAWLGSITIYVLIFVFDLVLAKYIYLVIGIVVIIYTFYIRDVYGVHLKKAKEVEGHDESVPVSKMSDEEIAKLNEKIGIDVKTVKCPKCQSADIIVSEDASGLCQACKYGIMDLKELAKAQAA